MRRNKSAWSIYTGFNYGHNYGQFSRLNTGVGFNSSGEQANGRFGRFMRACPWRIANQA